MAAATAGDSLAVTVIRRSLEIRDVLLRWSFAWRVQMASVSRSNCSARLVPRPARFSVNVASNTWG